MNTRIVQFIILVYNLMSLKSWKIYILVLITTSAFLGAKFHQILTWKYNFNLHTKKISCKKWHESYFLKFSYLECNQIWLNHLIDYHNFIYITKLEKEKKALVTTTLTIMPYGIKINRTSKHMPKCTKFEP
jgi:hypothetical protein